MSKALKKLAREREEMAQHIALLEVEQSHRNLEQQMHGYPVKNGERLINSDRREAPSVARSRSSERMLSQSSHHTHERYAPERKISRTKSDRLPRSEHRQAHHVLSRSSRRSPERQVARTKSYDCDRSLSRSSDRSSERKLERNKSSKNLSRMAPKRGLSRSNSERLTNRAAPAERVLKRTLSVNNLKTVDQYY
jgi:hypothetical protein